MPTGIASERSCGIVSSLIYWSRHRHWHRKQPWGSREDIQPCGSRINSNQGEWSELIGESRGWYDWQEGGRVNGWWWCMEPIEVNNWWRDDRWVSCLIISTSYGSISSHWRRSDVGATSTFSLPAWCYLILLCSLACWKDYRTWWRRQYLSLVLIDWNLNLVC